MSWKRRWGIVTVLALAQAGIIIWYQGFFAGTSAPANPPPGGTTVVAVKPEPVVLPPSTGTAAPVPAKAVLPPPEFKIPPELMKGPPTDGSSSTAEPPQLPPGLDNVPAIPGPPAPPVTALPPDSSVNKAGGPPSSDGKVVPVSAKDGPPALLPTTPGREDRAVSPPPPLPGTPGLPPAGEPKPSLMPISAQAPAPPLTPSAPPKSADLLPSPPTNFAAPLGGSGSLPMAPASPIKPQPPGPPPVGLNPIGDPLSSPEPLNPAVEPKKQQPVEGPCPWTLRVEIVKGRTLLTAQTGKEVQFRVSCDKLDLQAPHGNIQASGNVRVASEGLQGACDKLMIAWQKDQVVLEGGAELKCQRDGQEVDLKAAKLTLRLTINGRPEVTRGVGRTGDVRGATFLSRSKSAHGEVRTNRLRPDSTRTTVQPAGGSDDGTYDRYPGNEPPRRGSKIDD
jgi:hypothetical protein